MKLEQFLQTNERHQVWGLLDFWAKERPNKTALIDYRCDHGTSFLSFAELHRKACGIVLMLSNLKVRPGQKALIFLRPSLDFHPLIFALFRLQIVPIFIDPSMPRAEFLKAVKLLKPEIMIAEPLAIWFSRFYSEEFSSITLILTSKKSLFLDLPSLTDFPSQTPEKISSLGWPKDDDLAAVLYTSGGTGIPKGVPYTHNIFWHQTLNLKKLFGLNENDCDYPGFPLFSMFTLCLGMQSGITQIDPRGPARCDPKAVVEDLLVSKATFAAGSPAIWEKVAHYAKSMGLTFPDLKFVTMFGASVTLRLHQQWSSLLPNGTTFTPYGATEALPIACISGEEILTQFSSNILEGQGTCVGRIAPGIEIAIIPITNGVIECMHELTTLPAYSPGEICVKGAVTTHEYLFLEEETKLGRIETFSGIWHRMGDIGYLDSRGFLWFLGRKKHLLEGPGPLLSTESIEATYNNHPEIRRCALIWGNNPLGQKVPTLAIERIDGKKLKHLEAKRFEEHLINFSGKNPLASRVGNFVYVKKMPVDVRHNIKIDRQKLSSIYSF